MKRLATVLVGGCTGVIFAIWGVSVVAAHGVWEEFSPDKYCKRETQPIAFVLSGFCAWGGVSGRNEESPRGPCIEGRRVQKLRSRLESRFSVDWSVTVNKHGCVTEEVFEDLYKKLGGVDFEQSWRVRERRVPGGLEVVSRLGSPSRASWVLGQDPIVASLN